MKKTAILIDLPHLTPEHAMLATEVLEAVSRAIWDAYEQELVALIIDRDSIPEPPDEPDPDEGLGEADDVPW